MAHVLYRFYSATGQLLYVGITTDAWRRFSQHRADKAWWPEVATICQQVFANANELKVAEKQAIRAERPRYNKTHNTAGAKTSHETPAPIEDQPKHPLVERYFHTTSHCRHGNLIAEWQGRILNAFGDDGLLIELFSWLTGEPNGQRLVPLGEFMADSPILYETHEGFIQNYEHGELSHSHQCASMPDPLGELFNREKRRETCYGYVTEEEYEKRVAVDRAKAQAIRDCPFCDELGYRRMYVCNHVDSGHAREAQRQELKDRLHIVHGGVS